MTRTKLYLFIGSPGAGKTTVAQLIAKRSGAVHLWADAERHKMFQNPTHSHEESIQLYEYLNHRTAELLARGEDVVFDTNFNFANDRLKLRDIAKQNNADTIVIWMTTPEDAARQRSVHSPTIRNGYMAGMTNEQFDSIVSKLEQPVKNEKVIKIDGAKLDPEQAVRLLNV